MMRDQVGKNEMETRQPDSEDLLNNTTGDKGNAIDAPQGKNEHGDSETRGPVIDMSFIDNIRAIQHEGAPDLVGKLVTLYLTQASTIITTLGSAVEKRNVQDIFQLAHKFKSSSANVGALYLSSLLKDLETLGRQNVIEGTANLFAAIEKEFEAVKKSLEALMPDHDKGE